MVGGVNIYYACIILQIYLNELRLPIINMPIVTYKYRHSIVQESALRMAFAFREEQ